MYIYTKATGAEQLNSVTEKNNDLSDEHSILTFLCFVLQHIYNQQH